MPKKAALPMLIIVATVALFPLTGASGDDAPALTPQCYAPLVLRQYPQGDCQAEIEPNETHTAAQRWPLACITGTSCVAGSASWDGDLDWYAIQVCAGPVDLEITLDGASSEDASSDVDKDSDLDLYLYGDPPGQPLYRSESSGADETLSAGLAAGWYYILVSPVTGRGDYTLTVEALGEDGG